MLKKSFIIPAIIIVLALCLGGFLYFTKSKPPVLFRTAPIERGDLAVEVTASGSVNPHSTVLVGTQVSGTIAKLFADYNSHVSKGQIVALLDTTLLYSSVLDAKAALAKAKAQLRLSTLNCDRTKTLFAKGLMAQADLDAAVADSASAASLLSSASAQLNRAQVNFTYATIRSPITGTVIARNVDVGQTVAASFNTPTIFTIGDDLTKMQIQTSIDEADIGQIKSGQVAHFTVDAYPSRTFTGTVSQIRLQPTTVQNVVTYIVLIDVNNPDMALLPGMTANVTVEVQKVENVVIVPSAALKFSPMGLSGDKKAWHPSQKGDSAKGALERKVAGDTSRHERQWKKDGQRPERSADQGRIFVLVNDKPVRIPVKVGLSNGAKTAVEGALEPGLMVIIGVVNTDKNKPAQAPPFGAAGGGHSGMGR